MNLYQLRYFVSVGKHLNFTRAAEECHVSQTAISQQIANLEDSIGIKLFERNHRWTRLTPGGKVFLERAIYILETYNHAVEEARYAQDTTPGQIRIGYCRSPWEKTILSSLLRAFRSSYPDIILTVTSIELDQVIPGLLDGLFDFTFSSLDIFGEERRLTLLPMGKSPACIIVSRDHSFADQKSIAKEDLKQETFLMIDDSKIGGIKSRTNLIWQSIGFIPPPEQIYMYHDLDTLIMMIKANAGITILPKSLNRFRDTGRSRDLAFIDLEDDDNIFTVGMAWFKERKSPVMELFLNSVSYWIEPE